MRFQARQGLLMWWDYALVIIQVIGFLAATYFLVVWIPASVRARRKGLLFGMSRIGLIDFIGFPIAAWLVYALTMTNLLTHGPQTFQGVGGSLAVQRFAVWTLVTAIVTLRAVYWTVQWAHTPVPPKVSR